MKECENEKISIILPAYNVKQYIGKCFDSILAQTYEKFEVICIDDGSTDGTGEVCNTYQKKDDRIKVYHNENRGVSFSRNYGLEKIEGEWFCFIDADDWIEADFLERMYKIGIEAKCDIVACGIDKTYGYTKGIEDYKEKLVMMETSRECIQNFICDEDSMQGFVWNKLYRTRKYADIRFDIKLKINEDCMYVYEVLSRCKRACLTTLPLYHYYIRPDSACHKKATNADFSAANVFLKLYEKVQSFVDTETLNVLKRNYVNNVVHVLVFAKDRKNKKEISEVKKRCKTWKADVWKRLSMKQKLKFCFVMCCR